MVVVIFVVVLGFFFLQDMETKALTTGASVSASQYATLKYVTLGIGVVMEVTMLALVAKTKLAERPKVERIKLRVPEEKPELIKVRVAEPGRKEKERLKVRIAEPGKKVKPELFKIRVVEPGIREEKRIMKFKAVELTQAEKEGRIKEVIETFWKKKGEASMDEVVGEAAKHGIDRRDVERFIESEKKRGRLALET